MSAKAKTSARVAKVASNGLRTGNLTRQQTREVSGSALEQTPSHKKGTKKGR